MWYLLPYYAIKEFYKVMIQGLLVWCMKLDEQGRQATTFFMVFSITYYLKLHKDMSSCYRFHFLLTKIK